MENPGDGKEKIHLEICTIGQADRDIIQVLEGLHKQLVEIELAHFLRDNWKIDSFVDPEWHRNKTFFEDLRNVLRDFGVRDFWRQWKKLANRTKDPELQLEQPPR